MYVDPYSHLPMRARVKYGIYIAIIGFSGASLQGAVLTSVDFSGAPSVLTVLGDNGIRLSASGLVYRLETGGDTGQAIDSWTFANNHLAYDARADTYFAITAIDNRRGTLQIMNDNNATTGMVTVGLDFAIAAGDSIFLELYAWNAGETSPSLSWGGPSGGAIWNDTVPGPDAVTLLDQTYTGGTSASEAIDLGVTGYDYYMWRVGLSGLNGESSDDTLANSGTTFSNLSVTAVPEPAAALLGIMGSLLLLRRRR